MVIIGEKINATRKAVQAAIATGDAATIAELAWRQAEAGANYIDINAGTFVDNEAEKLTWLAQTVQQQEPLPLCIDSPNPLALAEALSANVNADVMINSITAEKGRWEAVLPLVVKYRAKVIALTMDDGDMPETIEERLAIAERLVTGLTEAGVPQDHIFIDPLVRPIATGTHYAQVVIGTMQAVKARWPKIHLACGLSNISFGLPARKLLNQAFFTTAMQAGLDGAILDPLDERLMATLYATKALLDQDEYCMSYITRFREGKLNG